MIRLPRGVPVRQNVNPARINLPEAMGKLRVGDFSGYLHFVSNHGDGLVLFQSGHLISAFFVDPEVSARLIAYDAIARIFQISIRGHATLNIYRLSADLIPYLHALLHGRYLQQGKVLHDFNVRSLLDYLKDHGTTACLRVYTEKKCALIFYDQGYPLGFFHDGSKELEAVADLTRSVALDPGALLDIVEVQSADDLVLADLMASADLRPIWQRTRKALLEEQNQKEQVSVADGQQHSQHRKQYILNTLKTIGGTYLGNFGAAQVEKAFSVVGSDLTKAEMEQFYLEIQRMGRLVSSQSKINRMIEEMRVQVNAEESSR